jgi:hypothetical protein
MKRLLYLVAWLVSVLLVSIVLTTVGLYVLTRPSLRVIHTWKQPDNIQYDAATYYLSVVESDLDWRGFPVHVSRRYFVYVGRDSGTPTYGHMIDFSFYPIAEDIQTHIRQSTVEWSSEGVTFQTVSGHQLFIPKRMFIGGR